MAGLTRVPAPRSPFDGRSAAFGGLLVVVIVALAVEPWGSTRAPAAPDALPVPGHRRARPAGPGRIGRRPCPPARTGPRRSGPRRASADWSIRTSTARVDGGAVGRPRRAGGHRQRAGRRPRARRRPRRHRHQRSGRGRRWTRSGCGDSTTSAVRSAWTWPASPRHGPTRPAWAVGLRAPGAAPGQVAALAAGPVPPRPAGGAGRDDPDGDAVRSRRSRRRGWPVAPGPGRRGPRAARRLRPVHPAPPAAGGQPVDGRGDPHRLGATAGRRGLPRGPDLAGPRARRQGCWPVPIGPASALGVNLPAGQRVAAIELAQVDPLPGPVALDERRSGSAGGPAWRRSRRRRMAWPTASTG